MRGTGFASVNTRAQQLQNVKAVAFDLDGTLYLQGTPLPGAVALLNSLRAQGIPIVFMTNNSSVSKDTYMQKLVPLGGLPEPHEVLTSNDVMLGKLKEAGFSRPYLLATEEVRAEYASHGFPHSEDNPDSVVMTFDMELTFHKIAQASKYIAAGLPYVATHPDVTCPIQDGFLPDAGSFIEMFYAATGRRPEIYGKPAPATIRAITDRLRVAPEHIAFVGDRLTTDIQMGNDAGFVSVLTFTGVTTQADLAQSDVQPALTVNGMEQFAALLNEAGIIVSYL